MFWLSENAAKESRIFKKLTDPKMLDFGVNDKVVTDRQRILSSKDPMPSGRELAAMLGNRKLTGSFARDPTRIDRDEAFLHVSSWGGSIRTGTRI